MGKAEEREVAPAFQHYIARVAGKIQSGAWYLSSVAETYIKIYMCAHMYSLILFFSIWKRSC